MTAEMYREIFSVLSALIERRCRIPFRHSPCPLVLSPPPPVTHPPPSLYPTLLRQFVTH